ncbi:MAG TPA: hypothetical protein PKD49_15380 [Hyphomicrobium sp.]|nr:hypothetical protein [Hyphomicrobium sp.]
MELNNLVPVLIEGAFERLYATVESCSSADRMGAVSLRSFVFGIDVWQACLKDMPGTDPAFLHHAAWRRRASAGPVKNIADARVAAVTALQKNRNVQLLDPLNSPWREARTRGHLRSYAKN